MSNSLARAVSPHWPLRRPLAVCVAFALYSAATYAADLPVQCGTCGSLPFVGSGAAHYTIGGAIGTVTQQSDRAILNWQSFDIAAGNRVIFNQPTASSAALNRIFQGEPSKIFGALQSNGHVYLINQNGFLFGAGSRVNTHALTASTLDISDQIFNSLGPEQATVLGLPTFAHDQASGAMGVIEIAAGAALNTDEGGRILLLAPEIVNRGTITTPGGEALLAASQDKVYLTTGYSPTGVLAQKTSRSITDVRGIVVEVGTGGSVTNLGKILAERGSIGLVGLAVNQEGLVRATTSVNQGGSVWLVARDQAGIQDGGSISGNTTVPKRAPVATHTGTLVLGANSVTEIGLDTSSSRAVDAQQQPQSRVELMGKTITMQSGAEIAAAGGSVMLTATNSPGEPAQGNLAANDTAFVMESGSRIDVAGATSAELPMSRNLLSVELRGSQLADSPLQREGPLRNRTVVVDVRKGTPFASIAANAATVERSVAERLAVGGQVSVVSEGAITIPDGANIDFSGGSVTYLPGALNTTKLVRYDGALVDISQADPGVQYLGIYEGGGVSHPKWGVTETFGPAGGQFSQLVPGYVEGKDAGSLQLQGRNLALGGTLRGDVSTDLYQRLPAVTSVGGLARPYDQIPLRGALMLGDSRGVSGDFGLQDFALRNFDTLHWDGIGRLSVYASGTISLAADQHLLMPYGSQLNLLAGNIDLEGTIESPGGAVTAAARDTRTIAPGDSLLRLGTLARLDTSGRWVNDRLEVAAGREATTPIFTAGGAVSLQSEGDLTLDAGSVIDTSGGARLSSTGALTGGKGGSIALAVVYRDPRSLHLAGELRSDSLTRGGTLSLTAPAFAISPTAAGGANPQTQDSVLLMDPAFFANRGFSAYTLAATHAGIEVSAGTQVQLQATNLVVDPLGYGYRPTGSALRDFATVALLPDYQRGAVSLNLLNRRAPGIAPAQSGIVIAAGARIASDPGAAILLESDARLLVDGTIDAPAGAITLRQVPPANSSNEFGYDPTQALWLGPNARLLAAALFRAVPSAATDLRSGQLLAGGSVRLEAPRSYVFTDPHSLIDVSGLSDTIAVQQGQLAQLTGVNADAGGIFIQSSEGGILAGTLRAAPGAGSGARGGSLSIAIGGGNRAPAFDIEADTPFPLTARELRLTSNLAPQADAGSAVPESLNGILQIAPDAIQAGGFSTISLTSISTQNDPNNGRIFFDGGAALSATRELVLTAPVIASSGGTVDLRAAHVVLGSSDSGSAAPSAGASVLNVRAGLIDLVGNVSLQGFGGAPSQFVSDGDIRLTGRASLPPGTRGGDLARITGQFRSAADITLSAQQVYPTTLSDYRLSVERSGGTLRIIGGPPGAVTPQSAAGLLELSADTVQVSGTVRAPFGQIIVNAANADIEAGGLLSTSGAGVTVPFGNTEFSGVDWIYRLNANAGQSILEAPAKRVAINADTLTLSAGSVIDITGGGDLLASEFVPGPGGTNDILAAATASSAFAVVPTLGSAFASYDPALRTDVLDAGRTVLFDGAEGLPAGEYAILPAAYALLPGAFLLTPRAQNALVAGATSLLASGTQLATGSYGYAGTSERDSLPTTFVVETGAQLLARAAYKVTLADSHFGNTEGAQLNRDAGQLVLNAGVALNLGGSLAQNTGNGRGSIVDIVADQLSVVAARSQTANGFVEVVAADLNALGADSVALGAVRRRSKSGTSLDVEAVNVQVQAGSIIDTHEVLFAGKENVTIAGGAQVNAGGTAKADTALFLNGDSALLRVSAGAQARVVRTASAGSLGVVDVQQGAILNAAKSITIDASGDADLAGDVVTHGGSLSIGVPRITFGVPQAPVSGLLLTEAQLAALDAQELILGSRSAIDVYGALNTSLKNVVLDAAGLDGFDNAGQIVALNADRITLRNSFGGSVAAAANGTGTLQLSAREIELEQGDFAIGGFSDSTLAASDQLIGGQFGRDASLNVAGNLNINTSRLTTGAGAHLTLASVDSAGQTVGAIRLLAPASAAALPAATALGGRLDVLATSVILGTRIELPSGDVRVHATGVAGISLTDAARISVAGIDTRFGDDVLGSVGGRIALRSDQGGVSLAAGAVLDASGAASGANAGRIELAAAGEADLAPGARLAAHAGTGYRGGTAIVSSGTLAQGFSALNAQLAAGGFTDRIDLRTGSGDIQLAAGQSIVAHNVALTADGGRIDIAGVIDARSASGGQVTLNARDDLALADSAAIDASATVARGRGGRVSLGTAQGLVSLAAGSTIRAAGLDAHGAEANDGVVLLRAPRVGTDSVGVAPPAGKITGVDRIQIEAFRSYQADTLDAGSYAAIAADSANYMANAPAILASLGLATDARAHLLAGEEIDSSGNLSINGPLDLLGVRPGGEAGVLTLRAAGDLLVNGTLSDGVAFQSAAPGELPERDTVQTGPSWSYRLAAGADLASADVLATAGDSGDVVIGSGALIRTGTGNIQVAAARDIRFADSTAAIYTAGENRGAGLIPVGSFSVTPEFMQTLIYNGDFLQHGGDIGLRAARDIVGADSGQFINDWMARAGGTQNGALTEISVGNSWAINVGKFRQNVGTLGGGNASIAAGGNIDNLGLMLPTTGQPVGPLGSAPAVAGGGDLTVYSGGDLRGGMIYVEQGKAALDVGGSVTVADGNNYLPVLAVGGTRLDLQARQSVSLEAIVNPSALPQSATQGLSDFVTPKEDYFFTYTPESAAAIAATSGDVLLRRNDLQLNSRLSGALNANQGLGYQVLPASLAVHALQGNATFGNYFTMFPAPHGNLDVVAAGNIGLSSQGVRAVALLLSDADVNLLPNAANPTSDLTDASSRLTGLPTGNGPTNAARPVHEGDATPVRIIARDGTLGIDPEAARASGTIRFSLYLSKLARIRAAQIANLNLVIQHDNPDDISVVASKGDIDFPTQRASDASVNNNSNGMLIDGPGRLDVIAGGSVSLAASEGVISRGNSVNVALPAGGAAISVQAGVDPDLSYQSAIDKYLMGGTYAAQLDAYLRQIGVPITGSPVDTLEALSKEQQRPFMLAVYFNELKQAGIGASKGVPGAFDRGYEATKTFFGTDKSTGNLNMFLSRIATLAGGDINIVVPHGFVNAGVANASVIRDKTKLNRLGIVAEGAGSINAMVGDSFLVNQTRVFALDGGDILVWSENKDIDAGGGAKTTLTVPRTQTLYNFDALPVSLIPPAIAGSGIRTAVTTPGRAPGSVYLFAPSGIVNAGDAGIQSAGNVTIAAVKVIGAENISAGGVAVGVPVDTGGLGASLAGASSASSGASNAASGDVGGDKKDESAPLADAALSWLEVFVLGLGEENCKQDDLECLKRQKKP